MRMPDGGEVVVEFVATVVAIDGGDRLASKLSCELKYDGHEARCGLGASSLALHGCGAAGLGLLDVNVLLERTKAADKAGPAEKLAADGLSWQRCELELAPDRLVYSVTGQQQQQQQEHQQEDQLAGAVETYVPQITDARLVERADYCAFEFNGSAGSTLTFRPIPIPGLDAGQQKGAPRLVLFYFQDDVGRAVAHATTQPFDAQQRRRPQAHARN